MLRPRSVRPQLALCGFRIYKKIELGFSSNCLSDFPLYRFGFHGNKHVPGNCARAPPEEGSGKALRDVSLSVRDFPSRSDGRQPEGRQRRTRAALPRNRDSGRYRYIPYVPRFRRKTKRFFAFLRNCGEMKMYFHFAHMALVRRRKAPTLRQRTRKRCSGSCPRSKACATTTRKRC